NLRVTLSQFEELEEFARFGTRLDDNTKSRIVRGNAVRRALRQAERDPMPLLDQMAVLVAAMEGLFDKYDDAESVHAMQKVRFAAHRYLDDVEQSIQANRALTDEQKASLLQVATDALR